MPDRIEPSAAMRHADPSRRIVVAVRVYAADNAKDRPSWYTKATCLASIADAADEFRRLGGAVRTIALVDELGPRPEGELAAALERYTEVAGIRGGSARRSWKAMHQALRGLLAAEPYDLVYLVEDDHLHRPEALAELSSLPTDFGLLYCIDFDGDAPPASGTGWRPATNGVSSFAATRDAYERNRFLLRTMSNAGHAWDDVTWRTLQGPRHLPSSYVLWPLSADSPWRPWAPRGLWQLGWRVFARTWSTFRQPSTLAGLDPNAATHAEIGWLADDVDWEAVAARVGTAPAPTPEPGATAND